MTCNIKCLLARICFFFFQAEDGIRDYKVTGVQTCALPILSSCTRFEVCGNRYRAAIERAACRRLKIVITPDLRSSVSIDEIDRHRCLLAVEIGRASCRERV